jgi:SAM-dependent methyltransferase
MKADEITDRVERYYSGKVRQHGPTPAGVDWNSKASQTTRFDKLLTVCEDDEEPAIIDYGCGYGALLDYLSEKGTRCSYVGYDLSAEMIERAREIHGSLGRFTTDTAALEPTSFTLASGIFNVRLDVSVPDWERYVHETIDRLHELSLKGFAFNVLTSYSDAEYMRGDLYYADPLALFDRCKRRYSKRVALLHDYPLYEFTILVKR